VPGFGRFRFGFRARGPQTGHEFEDAFAGLAAGCLREVAVQAVQPGARMRVNQRQPRVLLDQMLERGNQRRVFEHVGVVAGMEGVAVTEHAGMVTRQPPW
jgi:hypothetical protein